MMVAINNVLSDSEFRVSSKLKQETFTSIYLSSEINTLDSLVQGLRLLLAHGSNLGQMPFLLPPTTDGYQDQQQLNPDAVTTKPWQHYYYYYYYYLR